MGNQYDRDGFVDYLRSRERAENTIDAYLCAMDQFFTQEEALSQEAVIRFKRSLLEDLSPRSVNLKLSALNAYSKYCSIPISVMPVKIQRRSFANNVISQADYQRLLKGLEADKDWKWFFLIKFMACTGARVSELIQFKKQNFDEGYIDLETKGKIRRIYFPKKLLEESRNYCSGLGADEYLFPGEKGKLSTRGIGEALYRFSKKYGIPKEVMHPHSFRHRFAINFLQKNKDISLLADLMGHSGVNTTMIYLRLSEEEQRKAVDCAVDW